MWLKAQLLRYFKSIFLKHFRSHNRDCITAKCTAGLLVCWFFSSSQHQKDIHYVFFSNMNSSSKGAICQEILKTGKVTDLCSSLLAPQSDRNTDDRVKHQFNAPNSTDLKNLEWTLTFSSMMGIAYEYFYYKPIIEIVNYPLLQYKKIKTSFLQMFYYYYFKRERHIISSLLQESPTPQVLWLNS